MSLKLGSTKFVAILGGSVMFIGLLALAGWITGYHFLASFNNSYIPMALSTAILNVVFGFILLTGAYMPSKELTKWLTIAATGFFSFIGLLVFLGYFLNTNRFIEDLVFPVSDTLGKFPTNQMSPYTGLLFLLSGIAIELNIFNRDRYQFTNAISGLGILVAFAGFTALLGYLFGSPILYKGNIIPLSMPTAIAFLLLGLGLIFMAGPKGILLRQFIGQSTSARVLRTILPLVLSAIILEGVLDIKLSQTLNINPIPLLALLTIIFSIITTYVVIWLTKKLFYGVEKAERELIQQKIWFQQLFKNSSLGIVMLDENDRVLEINKSFKLIFQLSLNEIIGKQIDEIISPEGTTAFSSLIHEDVNEKETLRMRKDKSIIQVHAFSVPVIIDGKQMGRYIMYNDITERKQMEEELRKSEFFFKESQRTASIGSYKTDFSTGLWESSEILDQIFGIDKKYNKSIQGWINIVHADDREMINRLLVEEVIANHQPFNKEYRIIRQTDGEVRWVKGLGKVDFDTEGRVTSLIGTIQDITESKMAEKALQESEARLNTLVQTIPDLIWLKDKDGVYLSCNRMFERFFGASETDIVGKTDYDFVDKDLADSFREHDRKAMELGSPSSNEEWVTFADDGHRALLDTIKTPMYDSSGLLIGVLGIARDITERNRVEGALKENEALLRDLNATKDKFFSIIAHDLKNPFNTILGFSNILAEKVQGKNYESIEKYAGIIQGSTQKVMDLLLNLLEWSRSQTGRLEYNPKLIEMIELIYEVTELANDAAQQKSISISRKLPNTATVIADKSMIESVLRNLISNAIKFTYPGGKIVVSVQQLQGEVMVSVSDNGVGMGKKTIEKLFRIDENTSNPGTQNESGTGLGLILCKEFVEKHGGRIWVDSEVGKGSKFCFSLPK